MGQQRIGYQIFLKRAVLVFAILGCLFGIGEAVRAQVAPPSQSSSGQVTPGYNRPQLGTEPAEPNPFGAANAARLQKMREDERHKRLKADTEKLVALTGELKAEVDKASKDELSLDVVRKAAEIEKLAHDVKERMKS